jgi:hypothetical protein
MPRDEKITLQMIYKHHTYDCLLAEDENALIGEVWLPLSLIEADFEGLDRGDQLEVIMPVWLARERDLI